ncbi:peptidylprolyl isomerase [Prevotella copri]|jgi:peptidyl-prolyl cis-trans isomerase SurA|uniref:Peptidylprolyl isomerase n=1 Tax=Segatella copri TaxID=165179 RepID=A0AAP3F823_9BACT|nr:peptidylprolyl isomerase [Segatella copri]MCW4128453.1 peptidylprolyl isomerase [Segatella copri]MCW4415964.1 peptidylprolyl isomerase [Segatella copri]MCW4421178.1 peptidylprolyl isomerase [Segatella copri]
MKTGYKMSLAFIAMLLIMGMSASASRMGMSRHASVADSDSAQQEAVNDSQAIDPGSIIDEVIWVVGDEAILKSDVEVTRLQSEADGIKFVGDPDCSIPEQIAVQKLFLHQAAIDSIEVSESEVMQGIDDQINYWVSMIGSREKLEEYRKQSITQMRQQMHDDFKNRQLIQKMKQELVKDIKVSPAQVRKYFNDLPQDSIPFVPTEVEVEILTMQPRIPMEEISRVKNQLRDFTDRVNKGETTFATLARMYSEDPGSARMGGEMDYIGRGMLDPAFANVAFNLTDPKKISKIVESEFGYHIIQLIDKRGDKIKCRHILLKPQVSQEAIDKSIGRLDSIGNDIRAKKFTFEAAVEALSDDKDTRNNKGLMANTAQADNRTSKFQMKDLPTEVARVVDTMKVGQISTPFTMVNSKGKTTCALIKLVSRVEGHRATITEDFQVMKDVVLAKEREKTLHDWVVDKIKKTYVRMNDRYKNCNFEYQGWVK